MKTITLNTPITFNATGDKYSIIEQTPTGFQFKPIKFEKGLQPVPRTFEEVKEEFLAGQIDIEGFEHNEADIRLVELLMDGYIKQGEIESLKESMVNLANEKSNLESKLTEQTELLQQKESTLLTNESTISEQQGQINEQKGVIMGLNDEISNLKNSLNKEKLEHSTTKGKWKEEKKNWEAEKKQFETTIAGLEAMAEN